MFVVVAYDIPDDRRRTRVAKLLDDYGDRVQYSIFEMNLDSDRRFEAMQHRLQQTIDPTEDSVRIYHLCRSCTQRITLLGQGELTRDEPFVII